MSSCRWLRHRPGGMGVRSERPGITGATGPSLSWGPWPRPVARAVVGMQGCTQIGENGLSTQPPLACRMRFSVRVRPQSASLRESPVAEWGTCVRCCGAIRRGVNSHEPPKSRKMSTNREKLLVLLAIERAFSKLLKLLCSDMTLSGHCRNQTSRDIALGAVTYLCPDGRS